LVDETLDAYVDWREECAGVRDAYRRWSTAPLSHVTDAFREYRTALDNEEHAANHMPSSSAASPNMPRPGLRTSATSATGGRLDPGGDAAVGSRAMP